MCKVRTRKKFDRNISIDFIVISTFYSIMPVNFMALHIIISKRLFLLDTKKYSDCFCRFFYHIATRKTR